MIKINGKSVSRIPINGKETLRVMRNGQQIWSGTGLPAGYTLLEYIESTGQQYIDTGCIANENTVIHYKFSNLSLPRAGDHAVFGTGWGTFHLIYSSVSNIRWYSGNSVTCPISTGGINSIIASNKSINVNGNTYNVSGLSSFPQLNLCLLNTGDNASGSGSWRGVMRIHNCQIYKDDVLIRDFIPCKTPNGVCGLYDKVNKQFYGSASSTAFNGA